MIWFQFYCPIKNLEGYLQTRVHQLCWGIIINKYKLGLICRHRCWDPSCHLQASHTSHAKSGLTARCISFWPKAATRHYIYTGEIILLAEVALAPKTSPACLSSTVSLPPLIGAVSKQLLKTRYSMCSVQTSSELQVFSWHAFSSCGLPQEDYSAFQLYQKRNRKLGYALHTQW